METMSELYEESLRLLKESGIPFLLSGTYAVTAYTGIQRPTKDLDVFCKPGDYPRILAFFQARGYRTDVEDERWIAKVWQDKHFFDVIFAMSNGTAPITDVTVTDDLADVLDDATWAGSATATSGAATLVGSTLFWSGDLALAEVVTVTYTVVVTAAGLALGEFSVRAGAAAATFGETLRVAAGTALEVGVTLGADGAGPGEIRATLVRSGAVVGAWAGPPPLRVVHREVFDGRPAYFRLDARGPAPHRLLTNPVFVRPP